MGIRACGWSGASEARPRRRSAPPTARAAGQGVLDRFLDLAGLEALRADVRPLGDAVEQHADALQVRVETTPRRHHRVAPVVPERRLLAAGCADLGHGGGYAERSDDSVRLGVDVAGKATWLFLLVGLAYYVFSEALTGATLGKRIVRIRVVDEHGEHPTLSLIHI